MGFSLKGWVVQYIKKTCFFEVTYLLSKNHCTIYGSRMDPLKTGFLESCTVPQNDSVMIQECLHKNCWWFILSPGYLFLGGCFGS